MYQKNKAQASMDYLLLIGGSVLVASLVIIMITSLISSNKSDTSKSVYQKNYSCLTAKSESLLIGYWQFEGNLNDCSLNNHQGTAFGNPSFDNGKIGKAIFLDNSTGDYVDFGNIDLTGDQLTVEFWINAVDNSGLESTDNKAPVIIDWMEGSLDGTLLCYIKSNPSWSGGNFNINSIICTYGSSGSILNDLGTISTAWYGEWHHIAFVLDGTDFTVYTDGVFEGTISGASNIFPENEIFALSFRNWVYGVGFHGYVDELRIYKKALSQSEIQVHALN